MELAFDFTAWCRLPDPVKLLDANPGGPFPQGAAYDLPGRSLFADAKRNLRIRLVEKLGDVCRIAVEREP